MSTSPDNLKELLPAASQKAPAEPSPSIYAGNTGIVKPAAVAAPPPSPVPELPAPPGVKVDATNTPSTAPPSAKVDAAPSAPQQSVTANAPSFETNGTPATKPVDPLETTRGQLNDLFTNSASDPLFQRARADATKEAAGHGLQNSSIATQAGEEAVFRSALPIASETAGTYERRSLAELEAANQFGLQRTGFEQNKALSAQESQQASQRQAEAGKIQSTLQAEEHVNRLAEQAAAGDIQAKLQFDKFGFDTKLSAQENVQRLEQLAKQGDLDAKGRLDAFNYQTLLLDQQAGNEIKLEDKRLQSQITTLGEQLKNSLQLADNDSRLWVERQNLQHQQTLEEITAQVAASTEGNLSVDRARATQQLQGQYLTSVAGRQAMTSQEISTIYATQGLTPQQQQNAVSTAVTRLQTDLATLSAYYKTAPLWDANWDAAPPNVPTPAPPAGPQPGGPGPELLPPNYGSNPVYGSPGYTSYGNGASLVYNPNAPPSRYQT